MKRTLFFTLAVCFTMVFWAFGIAWPAYEWEGVIYSPDGRFSLVVIREDAAAFADFSYHVYCFQGKLQGREEHETIRPFQTWLWRGHRLYEGDQYYRADWVGSRAIDIKLSGINQTERDIPRSYLCETEKVVVSRTYEAI